MVKRLAFVAAVAAAVTCAPSAQAAPANKDECLKLAFDLAQKAADKKLAAAQSSKAEELISKMEDQCEAEKFADAEATMKDISAAIEGK